MGIKCFYHSTDLDGECSGAIVKHHRPKTELFPFDYGKEFPWDKISLEDEVYMVDISLSRDDMIKLKNNAKYLIYIDHHISKINELKDLSFEGIQQDGMAACVLTWIYFTTNNLKTSKIPILNMQGEAIGIVGIFEDITAQKLLENKD